VPKFAGAQVPSLAEVLDLTRGKALLMIEVKQPDIEEHVARVVRETDAIADCEVHSFYPQVVRQMRAVEPKLSAALLTDGRRVVDWNDFFSFALSLNAQGVSVYHAFATPERVRQGQRRSLTFMTWTVDEEGDIERMLAAGVDSICSNFPDVLRRITRVAG
jgi:glycerophosphoryl diester phosphodiesterase